MSIRFFPDGLDLGMKYKKQRRNKHNSRNWNLPIPGSFFRSDFLNGIGKVPVLAVQGQGFGIFGRVTHG